MAGIAAVQQPRGDLKVRSAWVSRIVPAHRLPGSRLRGSPEHEGTQGRLVGHHQMHKNLFRIRFRGHGPFGTRLFRKTARSNREIPMASY